MKKVDCSTPQGAKLSAKEFCSWGTWTKEHWRSAYSSFISYIRSHNCHTLHSFPWPQTITMVESPSIMHSKMPIFFNSLRPKNILKDSALVELQNPSGPHMTLQMEPLWSRTTHPKLVEPGFPLEAPSKLSFQLPIRGGLYSDALWFWWGYEKHEITVTQSLTKSNKENPLHSELAINQLPTSLMITSITSPLLLTLLWKILLFISLHTPHIITCTILSPKFLLLSLAS